MIKKLKFLAITGLFTVLILIAHVGAASACFHGHYQPELPESLRR